MDETNKQEILEAINTFATHVEERFNILESDVAQIKDTMVTKDYLDEKMGDLRGDLVLLTRKEDKKVVAIIELLVERNIIAAADAKKILGMDPFPQFSVSSH